MDEFKPNSHKYKQEVKEDKPKFEKIVKSDVRTKKKSEMSKLSDIFIAEDAHNVKSYIFMDVLVPAIKKAVADIVTDGIHMILYGGTSRGKTSNSPASKISYSKYYGRDDHPGERSSKPGYNYDSVSFDNRGDAEAVLDRLEEALDAGYVVSVADLYELVGVTPKFTDNNYGWMNLHNAEIVRGMDGRYSIKMPRAIPIKSIQ